MLKSCRICKKEKLLRGFYKDKAAKDGHAGLCKECDKQRRHIYYLNNQEHIKLQSKKYRLVNKDWQYNYNQNYYKVNKNSIRKNNVIRDKKARHSNPNALLRHRLRARLHGALKGNYKNGSFVTDLGCPILQFKLYIESLFLPNMSWENYNKWHLDHIVPLSSFDLTDRTQFLKACHYTNYQPLWCKDNLKKGKKLI